MSTKLKTVSETGDALIRKGDPRVASSDIDTWFQTQLHNIQPAASRSHLYGSDAGLCARKNVLLEHNVWFDNEITPASAGYMAVGVALENMLAEGLRRTGRLIQQNIRIVEMPGLKIAGKIDLAISDHEGQLALVEVKSCGKLPEAPKPEHLAQIQMYCAVSGIHRAWLTYISRDIRLEFGSRLALQTFPVETGEEILTQRLATAALSRLASDSHRLPPMPPTFHKHSECHYCAFRDAFCWGERPGLGGALPTTPMALLEPIEYMELESEAIEIAKRLYSESSNRLLMTINRFLLLDEISIEHKLLLERAIFNSFS
jgi:CRISPR/Cas system-associated exonuclease Cas4 (RecB family)